MKIKNSDTLSKTTCYHCGDECESEILEAYNKAFCCHGCKMVYEILNQKGLCEYYDLEKNPGITQKVKIRKDKFAFLDDQVLKAKLVHFKEKDQEHVRFYLPQMHCSSCVWLLENLHKIDEGILKSQTNFLKKEVTIIYNPDKISLRKTAEILASIGYEPHISLQSMSAEKPKSFNKKKIYKLGVAGFCFGNVMMLSFPEYFSIAEIEDKNMQNLFSYLNILLSLPVFFYSASDFYVSSYKSLKQKYLNIDAPIALAIILTFVRSLYEIFTQTGTGYLDSMTGIVFFMLIGRYFQDYTYDSLSFERDYKSFFPLGVTKLNEDKTESQIPVANLKVGDRIKIHHGEIIPADGILFLGNASIDYSFVSGESEPVDKIIGEIIYAGGKQTKGAIELEIVKEVSQSYLTELWNNDVFKEDKQNEKNSYVQIFSRYFTYIVFAIAFITGIYWMFEGQHNALNSVTSILLVACPCALLLSATFANGNVLRYLGKSEFYAKNAMSIEEIAKADTIVFDKTGTITYQHGSEVLYKGKVLNIEEQVLIKSLVSQSNHPLSKAINSSITVVKTSTVSNYRELKGYGIQGEIGSNIIKLGSSEFVGVDEHHTETDGSTVFLRINNELKGRFIIKNKYRSNIRNVIRNLSLKHQLYVISGDNEKDKSELETIFGESTPLYFNQKPIDKLNFIKSLQQYGRRVIMIGDGLNDAGALRQSNAGIAITDDLNNFSPSCDAIMNGRAFPSLDNLIEFCKDNQRIIIGSFILSIIYNIVGLYYAVQGLLSPVLAAIIMPISAVSIVLFTSTSAWILSRKLRKTDKYHDFN